VALRLKPGLPQLSPAPGAPKGVSTSLLNHSLACLLNKPRIFACLSIVALKKYVEVDAMWIFALLCSRSRAKMGSVL